jgi:hypothetical protein
MEWTQVLPLMMLRSNHAPGSKVCDEEVVHGTYRQPVGCLAASAATTTLDVVAKKNSTNIEYVVYEH